MPNKALQVLSKERAGLLKQRAGLDVQIKKLEAAIAALGGVAGELRPKKFTMSKSARARIAAAQKARWAKIHAAKK